ncbi:MAG: hypothetical protein AB7I42_26030 [Bradyrhizobium sp.]|uniref:hypothetical protein n=1 Tax=Bradyrhizobium sp. TaxID=376 RepID=UPI003D0DF577
MTIERKDWMARQQTLATKPSHAHLAGLERMRQAAVPAEKLMADDHWRVYQQMLQGAIEAQVANRDRLLLRLMSDGCNSYEDMVLVKRLIAECEATIHAWKAAIDLPVQLLASAEQAAQSLAAIGNRFEEKEPADAAG